MNNPIPLLGITTELEKQIVFRYKRLIRVCNVREKLEFVSRLDTFQEFNCCPLPCSE